MPMFVDQEVRNHVVIVHDSPTSRTTLTVDLTEGLALLQDLTKYFGKIEFTQGAPMARPSRKSFFGRFFGRP